MWPSPAQPALAPASIDLRDAGGSIAERLHALRARSVALAERLGGSLERVPDSRRPSARNLLHYLALRQHDLRRLQRELSRRGLSSLGRCEAAVLPTIDAVLRNLSVLDGSPAPPGPSPGDVRDLDHGHLLLDERTATALGPRPLARVVRIMVTMPSEAADDSSFVLSCASAGMDLARINTAHDEPEGWSRMIKHIRAASVSSGRSIRVLLDLPGPKLRVLRATGPGGASEVRLHAGDRLAVAFDDGDAPVGSMPRATITHPQALALVKPNDRIAFDDGKLLAVCETVSAGWLIVRVDHAPAKGARLKPGRGINLPDTVLDLPALSEGDLEVLRAFGPGIDLIGLSFARSPRDIERLFDELRRCGLGDVGVVLKLETCQGFDRLADLLLTLLRWPSSALMIARGDLAVECGFERLAEVQEEIMWFCEASHTPIIWATQVLEGLAKTGQPSRAEITDAAMAQRAECVMLNKGPHAIEAVRVLDDLLRRMAGHQRKKTPMMRALRVADSLGG